MMLFKAFTEGVATGMVNFHDWPPAADDSETSGSPKPSAPVPPATVPTLFSLSVVFDDVLEAVVHPVAIDLRTLGPFDNVGLH